MKSEANLIQFFNVYYPARTLILVVGEALIVWTSLLLGVVYANWGDQYLVLVVEHGYLKIFLPTLLVLVASYWLDLYDTSRPTTRGELYFRLLLVPGMLAFILAGVSYFRPQYVLGNGSTEIGLLILAVALILWRMGFARLICQLPILTERVYVLGTGERAQRLVQGLRQNPEIGVEVVSWSGRLEGVITRESVAAHLFETVCQQKVHRVIIAVSDRRGSTPVQELLDLSVRGVKIEEATSWLEKISGKIEVENLYPSWLFLGGGFHRGARLMMARRMLSVIISLIALILILPWLPLIVLVIKLDSWGPVFYTQDAVGKNERIFKLIKFRTTRQDAVSSSPSQLDNHDPSLSLVGKFLRASRLEDIPQLWSVLKGDMAIVGPRPERREFVEGILKDIPYYRLRHIVCPGLTGWAQVKYGCHSTVEDAREELQYDLFYLKNLSIGLDLLILFRTIKTVLVGPRQHRLNAAPQF